MLTHQGFMVKSALLVYNDNVASLGALGALLDSELDALTLFEVAVTVALDGGEVDENVRATFAFDKTVAFATVEPFDRTDDTFSHFINLLVKRKKRLVFRYSACFIGTGKKNGPWI
jgi:hypothetical protein